jgi:hypothetical protein
MPFISNPFKSTNFATIQQRQDKQRNADLRLYSLASQAGVLNCKFTSDAQLQERQLRLRFTACPDAEQLSVL